MMSYLETSKYLQRKYLNFQENDFNNLQNKTIAEENNTNISDYVNIDILINAKGDDMI